MSPDMQGTDMQEARAVVYEARAVIDTAKQELARLRAVNAQLVAALRELVTQVERSNAIDDHGHALRNLKALTDANAALAAAGEPVMSPQHTPTPWTADCGDGQYYGVFKESDGGAICYLIEPSGQLLPTDRDFPEHEANATFIVRACNSHDALFAALRSFIDPYEGKPSDHFSGAFRARIEAARAAVAAAEQP